MIHDIMAKLFGADVADSVSGGFYTVFIIVIILLLIGGLGRAFGNRGRKSK
jgi:hypothetical protein